ncbi:uncharacterized protein LOC131232557 [Magnolia sinica]|uniref:uncharacterized protein LOC131232557 n=1 Tax=Magnolia sinica TaxID=86752 RepID=UPI00265A3FA1|nr:uncharacterized protein LOC131232557 [Magnolia sinica]XP_058084850.1 uncharacterized protein LOC131232557 [Magnolia sinica]XP_058084851.1 uncharacterized protein LOC131232557 [Magnolia sinica]XP_058084852.1 uncharacterized protein LOC131232557 [Magnolia sinica]
MATEIHPSEAVKAPKKRKSKHKNTGKGRKKNGTEFHQESRAKAMNSRKMRKLFQKRAKEYNSDDDDDESDQEAGDLKAGTIDRGEELAVGGSSGEDEGANGLDGAREEGDEEGREEERGGSDDEDDGIQLGIAKFTEGCRAFRMAFSKIMKKNVSKDPLGPVLSGQKKLIAEKLAEEEAERKVKAEAKKEKHLVREKGHAKPANFLDAKEKFLVSVATKGVVKLFNAVNKAQNAQKGLNPARSKDAKVLGKRRKEAFLSELHKTSDYSVPFNATKGIKAARPENNDEPGWAPLRDNYMLTDAKLKDWDKMTDPAESIVPDEMPLTDSSSDDE